MKKCTAGPRHKWEFMNNVTIRHQTLNTVQLSYRGLYKCTCGERKYGMAQP